MSTLTIMVGLPRSGKDTWIEKNKGSAIVVSNDWIRENILGTHYSTASNAVVWSLTDAVLRVVLGQGHDAILNGVNHTKDVRAFYIKLAKQYNFEIKEYYRHLEIDENGKEYFSNSRLNYLFFKKL